MARALCAFVSLILLGLSGFAQESRSFTFHYTFSIKNLPMGKRVRVWIPAAHADAFQEVKIISAKGDLPIRKMHESKNGNEMYYAEASKTTQQELHFDVEYDVTRHERVGLGATPHTTSIALTKTERLEDLQPDALVPITGLPADLAAKVTQGENDPLDKARAIYDYVFTTMKYDKTGAGWGRGDVLYA
jgi:hypothetical protein